MKSLLYVLVAVGMLSQVGCVCMPKKKCGGGCGSCDACSSCSCGGCGSCDECGSKCKNKCCNSCGGKGCNKCGNSGLVGWYKNLPGDTDINGCACQVYCCHPYAHGGGHGGLGGGGLGIGSRAEPAPDASVGSVGYPYYTTRGPRDFLQDDPRSIGR